MNNFTKRLIFGSLYVALLIFGIGYGGWIYTVLFFLLMHLALYEFNKMQHQKSGFPYIIASLFYALLNNDLLGYSSFPAKKMYLVGLLVAVFIGFVFWLFSTKNDDTTSLGKQFLSLAYIALPFALLSRIPYMNQSGSYQSIDVLSVFLLVWVNDSFAYLVGKKFGKHKLMERISPKKTIEGFIGGLIFTFISALILSYIFNQMPLSRWLFYAGIVSVFGVFGDLIESKFKRQAGVKDSSNLIPGHGGWLDRLDSIIFITPFIYIYLRILYG